MMVYEYWWDSRTRKVLYVTTRRRETLSPIVMRRLDVILIVFVVFTAFGCSARTAGDPVIPPSGSSVHSSLPSGRSLWGLFDISVDLSRSDPVAVTPLRSTLFHLNVRKFLEESPCNDCLRIEKIEPTASGFNLDISITHPFADDDTLTGFDVRGIAFFEGSCEFPLLGVTASSPLEGDAHLANADGYMKLFNPVEYEGNGILGYSRGAILPPWMPDPDVTLGGFKTYYSEGQSEDEGGRRAFLPGDTVTRTLELVLPTQGSLRFGYAIDASWEFPMVIPPGEPDDFPPSANCPEPFRIDIEQVVNTLTETGGGVVLEVTAFDHQGSIGIIECRAEAPGLTDRLIVDDSPHFPDNHTAVFECRIPNEIGAADTDGEEILIEVVQGDEDKNLGPVSAWALLAIDVSDEPVAPAVLSIEPDHGYQDTIVNAVIHGCGFQENAEIELYQGLAVIPGDEVVVESTFTARCNFSLSGPEGTYTLYLENPDGRWGELDEAFQILPAQSICDDAFHTDTLGDGAMEGLFWNQYDAAFLVDGPYEGLMLATAHNLAGNSVVAVDVDSTDPGAPMDFQDALGHINGYTIWTADVDECNGWIYLSWLEEPDAIHVYSSSGEPIDTVKLTTQAEIRGLDHDGTGGFWVAYEDGLTAKRHVRHYIRDPKGPGYEEIDEDSFEVDPSHGPIQDIAIIPGRTIYILTSSESGSILSYDISGATPLGSGAVNHIFDTPMPAAFGNRNGDIEIDQTDPDSAFCRIVAYGRQSGDGGMLVKLDGDLIILNRVRINRSYNAMAINPDPDIATHHITLYPLDGSPGTYRLLETPQGW